MYISPNYDHSQEEPTAFMRLFQDRLATCPVPFTQIDDCISVKAEDMEAFYNHMFKEYNDDR